jgi:hypothetical protein
LNRELAGVEVVEVARDVVARLERTVRVEREGMHGAERIDLRLRFDADDFRAEGRERVSGDWAGAEPGKVRDAKAFEWSFRHGVLLRTWT